jgi:crossover junction endodeoxyribonuclease RuvC
MRILGIDPGSMATGFGVVDASGDLLVHVAHGTVRPRRDGPLALRLQCLYAAVSEVIEEHRPDAAVVEQVFVAASPRAALVLGQARGVVLAALAAGGLAVSEYSACQIKQGVTGSGRAGKRQVQTMVRRLLGLERTPARDASDALAAAIRHAHASRLAALGVVPTPRRRAGGKTLPIRVGRAR